MSLEYNKTIDPVAKASRVCHWWAQLRGHSQPSSAQLSELQKPRATAPEAIYWNQLEWLISDQKQQYLHYGYI